MKRVLVAEDNPVISRFYQIHFLRKGIEGSFFSTGAGLLETARAEPPDLVILDYELPDMKGPEVMRKLRATPSCADVPVVFITGHRSPELVESLRKEGAAEVFGKPVPPLQLIELIQRLPTSRDG